MLSMKYRLGITFLSIATLRTHIHEKKELYHLQVFDAFVRTYTKFQCRANDVST